MRALWPVDAAKYFSNFTLLPSGKMWALRPVDATKYFSNFTLLPSGKMRALQPIDAAKYFSDVHNYYIVIFLMCV